VTRTPGSYQKEIVMSASQRLPSPTRRLPDRPSIEQLRKQAKDLLDAYRVGDPAAVAEVERLERHPDLSRFALHDAQRVLARAYCWIDATSVSLK
jgi:hypothetical protein